jgi:hypothetical protein
MIDEARLRDFVRLFFGYGSWAAPLWFIGMEEGGGNSIDEIERRLRAWDGSDALADIGEYHNEIGGTDWFARHPPLQTTWAKLIRVVLASHGQQQATTEDVRAYQRDHLGRRAGETAIIELLPLPSPSTSAWLYPSWGVALYATREDYVRAELPGRIAELRRRLLQHKPKVVVFYGLGYREHWEAIAGGRFESVEGTRFFALKRESLFIMAPHPAAKGIRNEDFDAIGGWIAGRLSSRLIR